MRANQRQLQIGERMPSRWARRGRLCSDSIEYLPRAGFNWEPRSPEGRATAQVQTGHVTGPDSDIAGVGPDVQTGGDWRTAWSFDVTHGAGHRQDRAAAANFHGFYGPRTKLSSSPTKEHRDFWLDEHSREALDLILVRDASSSRRSEFRLIHDQRFRLAAHRVAGNPPENTVRTGRPSVANSGERRGRVIPESSRRLAPSSTTWCGAWAISSRWFGQPRGMSWPCPSSPVLVGRRRTTGYWTPSNGLTYLRQAQLACPDGLRRRTAGFRGTGPSRRAVGHRHDCGLCRRGLNVACPRSINSALRGRGGGRKDGLKVKCS